jgi:hypothetical protein
MPLFKKIIDTYNNKVKADEKFGEDEVVDICRAMTFSTFCAAISIGIYSFAMARHNGIKPTAELITDVIMKFIDSVIDALFQMFQVKGGDVNG